MNHPVHIQERINKIINLISPFMNKYLEHSLNDNNLEEITKLSGDFLKKMIYENNLTNVFSDEELNYFDEVGNDIFQLIINYYFARVIYDKQYNLNNSINISNNFKYFI
jgi:hypothetical protein